MITSIIHWFSLGFGNNRLSLYCQTNKEMFTENRVLMYMYTVKFTMAQYSDNCWQEKTNQSYSYFMIDKHLSSQFHLCWVRFLLWIAPFSKKWIFGMSSLVSRLGLTGSKCVWECKCTVKTSFIWKYLVCLFKIQSIFMPYTRLQLQLISVPSWITKNRE